ncbi:MAG: DnaB-like helicase N-terminal domain-containing protein, partial [Dehalococcoidales bacterium]|nr:DnaB-like helicase N-terminal domain-containing protein [Dehalococcoidales bacterium]
MPRSEDKLPIYDQEAERQVIGAIVLEPAYLGQVNLDSADFYHDDHRRIFGIIIDMKQRDEEISPDTVRKLVADSDVWTLTTAIAEALPLDCLAQAARVKELSRQRYLAGSIDKVLHDFRKDNLTSTELADRLRMVLDSISLPSRVSRMIKVSNPRIVQAESPTYKLNVSLIDGSNSVEIRLSSAEIDKPASFRRHIREKLRINPLLPKQYDEFIHQIVQQAVVESEQEDASTTETICYWIREWFNGANEAEDVEDLNQGYVKKEGARWFSAERLLRYLAGHVGLKLTRSQLWEAIHDRGGQKSRNIRLGEKVVKLWGINEQFFVTDKVAEGDQIRMDDDLSW